MDVGITAMIGLGAIYFCWALYLNYGNIKKTWRKLRWGITRG